MISMNWVKDYVNLEGEDLKELAVKITKGGLNVEDVISNHIDDLVIGQVTKCEPHPDSDHLHVCQVNVGKEELQIVCGASNVREGIKVIVALPGAILPGNFEIKCGKIRGIESNGMICAKFELGLEEKTEETYAAGITELGDDAIIGEDPLNYLGFDDTIYDLDNHKRRNNDVYYHIGFAYEVATVLSKKVTLPDDSYKAIKENINDHIKLKVETPRCPFYLAKMVKNIKIGESPDFIKKRLSVVGMRPINNVVDISNYVMLEYGQPMHFFDYNKSGDTILVRDAASNESIITLDGKKRELNEKDIVITDGNKPICIAGIMGGENTEVDEHTSTIMIEAAIFDSVSIRNTAARLNLKSEASIRYGKGLNYEYTIAAMNRACHLLEKYASGEVLSGEITHDKVDKSEKVVEFEGSEINKLLGIEISDADMKIELERLDFPYTYKEGKFKVTIPRRRLDVDPNINDIAEEIGRFYGYENLVSSIPKVSIRRGGYAPDVKIRKNISKRLRSLGLNECKTYTLVSKEMSDMFKYDGMESIPLPNPMSAEKALIRTSIIPSLLNTYEYNKARKVSDVLIYEVAKTYNKDYQEVQKVALLMKGNYILNAFNNSSIKVDFYLIKGIIENLLDYLGFKNRYTFKTDKEIPELHPGVSARLLLDRKEIGLIGRIHPSLKNDEIYVAELSISDLMAPTKPIKFKEANKYPEVVKDVAFVLDEDILNSEVTEVIKKAGSRMLADIQVFDLYKMPEDKKKSIAYKLTFVDPTRTLTENEVMEVFNKIIESVTSKLNAKLRG